ncbi:unnamed protein product [Phaedon cochleariae]|uniref:Uncharacterized protein n=1 Tax=Phaedon cochleariae TaxID=80249 RepID=A0A9N9SBF2_PHACE|nr:unnamed protein product [Phaedon cochleariae]
MDTGVHRQPRFGYVPLLGLLLANLLSNTAVAKYAPLGALRLTYEPVPYVQPAHQSHHVTDYWHAVNNPDGPPSPSVGSTETTEPQVIHHHHHLPPTGTQQQIVNINERPTEILIGETETEGAEQAETTPVIFEEPAPVLLDSNLEKPGMELIADESRMIPTELLALISNNSALATKNIVKRGTSNRYVKTRRNNKYANQKRRRIPTTTPEDYYDSYEDASATTTTTRRYKPKRRTSKPKRPILDSYEDSESDSYSDLSSDEDYEESYELTTRPQKKRRRTTTTTTTTTERYNRYRNKNKNKKHQKRQKVSSLDEYDDVEYDTERYDPTTTEIIRETERPVLRQRQPITTTEAPDQETTTGGSPGSYNPPSSSYGAPSYHPPSSSFVPSPSFNPPSSSYGTPSSSYGTPGSSQGPPSTAYGTSSSSYGAPSHSSYYQVPFSDWYSNEVTRNNIVHKVHDLIGFDKVFN